MNQPSLKSRKKKLNRYLEGYRIFMFNAKRFIKSTYFHPIIKVLYKFKDKLKKRFQMPYKFCGIKLLINLIKKSKLNKNLKNK